MIEHGNEIEPNYLSFKRFNVNSFCFRAQKLGKYKAKVDMLWQRINLTKAGCRIT
jgi:hypothetical protein